MQQADYEAFKQNVLRKSGIDLDLYRQEQMYRRLKGMLERTRLETFDEYFRLIESDPKEWAAFLDRITINVSELFRNPEKWEQLRDEVLAPWLKQGKQLRVWSAGCAMGAEPYTLAMILHDLSPGMRHYLLATDIDEQTLEQAKQGIYTAEAVKHVPMTYRHKYLRKRGDKYEVSPTLRSAVTFRKHNLLCDPFETNLDLIVCRNVVIYFTDEAKGRLYTRFRTALAPGGILFVGGTERIFNYRELGFETRLPFFYQRAA
ncbi:MAG TPA: protein-glutamate O-methyltransferase CheR [Chthonomonadales bacterium]|nr:protein-glutamate O-methyltransferase CheR [Chthonomonadales bacterium]